MKYAVIVTETCSEGGIVSRMAWLAETEDEMKAMVDACKNKCSYMGTQVMLLEEPNPWVKDKIAECMPNASALPPQRSGGRKKQIVGTSDKSAFNSGDLMNAMLGGNRIPQRGKL